MNYLEQRTIYYSVIVSELLSKSYEEVFDKISKVFCQNENQRLKEILKAEMFNMLSSSTALDMHITFLKAFCEDESEFGKESDEMNALEIKRSAMLFIEELNNDIVGANPLNTLFKIQKQNNNCSSIIALLLLTNGRYDNNSISMLTKSLKNGDLDSGIILLSQTKETNQIEMYGLELAKIQEFILHAEIIDVLINRYKLDKEKLKVDNIVCVNS